MIDERTASASSDKESAVATSIGKTDIKIGRRSNGDLSLEVDGGDGAGFDVYRDMSVAKLDEDILNSEERGNDTQAEADSEIKDFLTSLSPSEAKAKNVSMIGLANLRIEKLKDLLTAEHLSADMKSNLEYKLLVATNAMNMMTSISQTILDTYLDTTSIDNEDEQIGKEARSKSTLAHRHNDRVRRNAERRAAMSEEDSSIQREGLDSEAILAAKRQVEKMKASTRELTTESTVEAPAGKQPESLVPSDWKERKEFADQFFNKDMDEVPLERSDDNKAVLRDYLIEEVKMWAKNAREGQEKNGPNMRYSGSISGVLGTNIGVPKGGANRFGFDIYRHENNKPGMLYTDYQSLKFKTFVKDYLDLDITDVIPDYDKLFS